MFNNKKIKKFINNPRLFFSDMLLKHANKFERLRFIKFNSKHTFTIVSAVYGVEKYLDDYFKSLVNQRLDFKKHIHLVLVDDGSRDDSASIIKQWQKKYPNNITYVHKENGGQASARNLGLGYVNTPWVSFIDPDDFVSIDYFLSLANDLDKYHKPQSQIAMIGCHLLFYFEADKQFKNTHPLRGKFDADQVLFPSDNLGPAIQLSASSALFRMDIIRDNGLHFDPRIKPSFEDATFIAHYLDASGKDKTLFSKKALYFYRKREDESSTLDTSWQKKSKYDDVFVHGYLAVLRGYQNKYGRVPVHIQRTVLYDLMWYIKFLLSHKHALNILSTQEKTHFFDLFNQCLEYIESQTILDFNLAGVWFFHKVGLLGKYQDSDAFKQLIYIERVKPNTRELKFSFFAFFEPCLSLRYDGEELYPSHIKKIPHMIGDELFVYEYVGWVQIPVGKSSDHGFSIHINDKVARLSVFGKIYPGEVNLQNTLFADPNVVSSERNNLGHWVLMDRDVQADDNAEHLYRYIQKNRPEQKIYFAIRSGSPDWDRLKKEGFNLVAFGSKEHESLLKSCGKIISSHAEHYVHRYFPGLELMNKDFVFLQHGVVHNDLSSWLNTKRNMSLFITASPREYESIADDSSSYWMTAKEVALTGLARHDALWEKKHHAQTEKVILVMPTWRASIVGRLKPSGSERDLVANFMDTRFAQSWQHFLLSDRLRELSEQYGYRVVFFPHKNIEPYLPYFKFPSYIEMTSSGQGSIQDFFFRATFMITDYSSVAFEMGALEKPVIYYQFDEDDVFGGQHTTSRGYYDYARDGFGPKVTTEDELFVELERTLAQGGGMEPIYRQRVAQTFKYNDGKNCSRIYDAIVGLDRTPSEPTVSAAKRVHSIVEAHQSNYWETCILRALSYIDGNYPVNGEVYAKLMDAYTHRKQFDQADKIKQIIAHLPSNDTEHASAVSLMADL